MTPKHTPGPWVIHPSGFAGRYDITGNDDPRQAFASGVCEVYDDDDRQGNGTAYANARLIASAPDLLDALDTIAMGNTDPDRMVEIARQALAKALGESK